MTELLAEFRKSMDLDLARVADIVDRLQMASEVAEKQDLSFILAGAEELKYVAGVLLGTVSRWEMLTRPTGTKDNLQGEQ